MAKEIKTSLSQNGEMPVDFYSWGDQTTSGIISRGAQIHEELEEAFDSIEIEEDKETPETDYVLRVLGKEAGRIVIPFSTVVKDAYYDTETKEIVLVIAIGESGTKEIRFSVKDLIDTYVGDEVTIHVEKNVISITQQVMDKFTDLEESIANEEIRAESIENSLKKSIDKVETNYKEADAKLKEEIEEELLDKTKDNIKWQYSTDERKHLVLENHDSILGTSTDGSTYNVAMISKWDVVDVGSNKLPLNLNSTNGKITVNDNEEIVTTANTIPLHKIEALFD